MPCHGHAVPVQRRLALDALGFYLAQGGIADRFLAAHFAVVGVTGPATVLIRVSIDVDDGLSDGGDGFLSQKKRPMPWIWEVKGSLQFKAGRNV